MCGFFVYDMLDILYLVASKLLNHYVDRTMGLEDEGVKGWLADPSTYPEEFKNKAVFLWKSQRSSGDRRTIACLFWNGDRAVVDWSWFGDRLYGNSPVLLVSS